MQLYVLKDEVAENLRMALEGSEDASIKLLLSLLPSLEAHDPLAHKFLIQFYYQSTMNRWQTLCEGCSSNCCRNLIVVNRFDVERIAKFLEMSIPNFLERHTKETYCEGIKVTALKDSNPCQFLDGKSRCTIYPVRPNSCMFYPFLSFSIQTDGERIITPKDCPTGIKVAEYLRERKQVLRKAVAEEGMTNHDLLGQRILEEVGETGSLDFMKALLDKIRSQKEQRREE